MIHTLTLAELSQKLADRSLSSVEVTQEYLSRIARLDKQYNSFITITADSALAHAKQCDEQRANNQATPLTGLPIAHKDIFCTKGI
jgi:aspartyl-tRNA(Asn)/glutamyl-tRNA(Gln) amidotransferase subunit A